MSYALKTLGGNVAATYNDFLWVPRTIRGSSKYGVILLHGANVPDSFSKGVAPKQAALAAAIANAGIPCMASAAGATSTADLFANATAMGYITTMKSFLATATGCSSSKVFLIGVSQGGGTAVKYAALNPSSVAGVTGIIPMSNIPYLYNNNIASFTTQIAVAWGTTSRLVTDGSITSGSNSFTSATASFVAGDTNGIISGIGIPTGTTIQSVTNGTTVVMTANATATSTTTSTTIWKPLPMTGTTGNADLVTLAAGLNASVPTQIMYSSVDALIRPADVTTLASSIGVTPTVIDSTFGHADGTVGEIDVPALITWLKSNGA